MMSSPGLVAIAATQPRPRNGFAGQTVSISFIVTLWLVSFGATCALADGEGSAQSCANGRQF